MYPAHRVEKWAARTLAYYREHLLPDPRAGVIPATYLHVSMQEKDEKPEGLVRRPSPSMSRTRVGKR